MNKFTETATGALNLALECARELGHSFIGSEHLILAMLTDGSNVGAAILRTHRVTLQRFQQTVLEELGSAVLDKDYASVKTLCAKASTLLADRNRMCKLNK